MHPTSFDPRQRPWYIDAANRRAPTLTEPYRFAWADLPQDKFYVLTHAEAVELDENGATLRTETAYGGQAYRGPPFFSPRCPREEGGGKKISSQKSTTRIYTKLLALPRQTKLLTMSPISI